MYIHSSILKIQISIKFVIHIIAPWVKWNKNVNYIDKLFPEVVLSLNLHDSITHPSVKIMVIFKLYPDLEFNWHHELDICEDELCCYFSFFQIQLFIMEEFSEAYLAKSA